jgi:hypothetical protein
VVKDNPVAYSDNTQRGKGAEMSNNYEAPEITVLGELTDMTQTSTKPGVYFDFGNCNPGSTSQGTS